MNSLIAKAQRCQVHVHGERILKIARKSSGAARKRFFYEPTPAFFAKHCSGLAPSANLGDNYAVFEPTHGSAPKYAGQYKVNPIAMLLTAKLMLDWLKETDMATRLETAVARVIAEGRVRTYDMGGKASTLDVAKAIADYAD